MLDYFTTSLRNEFRAAGFLRLLRKSLGIMPGQPDNFIPPLCIKVVETACCLPDGPVISLKKRGSNHQQGLQDEDSTADHSAMLTRIMSGEVAFSSRN